MTASGDRIRLIQWCQKIMMVSRADHQFPTCLNCRHQDICSAGHGHYQIYPSRARSAFVTFTSTSRTTVVMLFTQTPPPWVCGDGAPRFDGLRHTSPDRPDLDLRQVGTSWAVFAERQVGTSWAVFAEQGVLHSTRRGERASRRWRGQ